LTNYHQEIAGGLLYWRTLYIALAATIIVDRRQIDFTSGKSFNTEISLSTIRNIRLLNFTKIWYHTAIFLYQKRG